LTSRRSLAPGTTPLTPGALARVRFHRLGLAPRLRLHKLQRQAQLVRVHLLRLLPEQTPAQDVELVTQELVLALRLLELVSKRSGSNKSLFGAGS